MRRYYIDENINILTGKDAEEALAKENDGAFVSDNNGIVKVSLERWQKAQLAEHEHWMVFGIGASNDRNDEHFIGFNNYETLQGMPFGSAIELGCGPFTNMRMIGKVCDIDECALLDPLIEDYLAHPHCRYTNQWLYLEERSLPALPSRLGRSFAKRLGTVSRSLFPGRRLRVKEIIPIPIESMPAHDQYDLVVIINVIEHCCDVQAAFDKILAIMKSGAYLVFHDKYYYHEPVARNAVNAYDAAHPLRVDRRILDAFLEAHFDQQYRHISKKHWTFLGDEVDWDALYYIGKRR